ncbi:MAG: His/Gly/Thr/Pro-type tRNA ligase C-terminal domain-containing protein [Candidatus Gracilibacteria bacterium]|jgi:prolyl-tRNA synthetase|nr:His/Gly/Thr/Pro-type tRNA ligase C-terminal domain-containing protein [Candidatus Gracilibacteria bacterium]
MKQSFFKIQTNKDAPHDEGSINAELLVKAGFVKKESAGVFTYMPIGLRVLKKVQHIIREEMDKVGMQEVLMPTLIQKENFEKTKRAGVDVAFETDRNYILGWSHEEIITPLAKQYINSYKNLPIAFYQVQTKFRNEPRAKSGLLRGREFIMKDGYSFHATKEDFQEFYEKVAEAYFEVFKRAGLRSYRITAGGGDFSKNISHEFSVITQAGEDVMIYCEKCGFAQNTELGEITSCPKCNSTLKKDKCVEAGNIFDLGEKYTQDFDLKFTNEKGESIYPYMGCYGIGVSRLMGTIIEAHHDENGMIWPKTVAPFHVHIISLDQNEKASEIEKILESNGIEVLVDDRDERAGKKFADSDLIGIPLRLVVSKKTLEQDSVEWKERSSDEAKMIKIDELTEEVVNYIKN